MSTETSDDTSSTDSASQNDGIVLGSKPAVNQRVAPDGERFDLEPFEGDLDQVEVAGPVRRQLVLPADRVDVAKALLREYDTLVVLSDPTDADLAEVKSERELKGERMMERAKQRRNRQTSESRWKGHKRENKEDHHGW